MKRIFALLLAVSMSACSVVSVNGHKVDLVSAANDHVQIAARLMQQGNFDLAQTHLQRALELNPQSAEAYNFYGLLLEQQNDPAGAEKDYRKAISLNGAYSQAHNNFGSFLYKQKRYGEAATEFGKAASDLSYEKRDQAYENLGRAAARSGDYEGAEAAFKRALSLNPNLPVATSEMADLQLRKGNTSVAYALYQQYLQMVQGQSQSARTLWLGIRLERVHGDRNALASYELALRQLYPNSEEYKAYRQSLGQGM